MRDVKTATLAIALSHYPRWHQKLKSTQRLTEHWDYCGCHHLHRTNSQNLAVQGNYLHNPIFRTETRHCRAGTGSRVVFCLGWLGNPPASIRKRASERRIRKSEARYCFSRAAAAAYLLLAHPPRGYQILADIVSDKIIKVFSMLRSLLQLRVPLELKVFSHHCWASERARFCVSIP